MTIHAWTTACVVPWNGEGEYEKDHIIESGLMRKVIAGNCRKRSAMATMDQKLVTISFNDKLILFGASLLALWVSHQLFYKAYELDPGENAVELGMIETSGSIRRRHAKSLAWGDVKGTSKLYLRDIVITPKEVGATVSWGKGQSLFIEPDTMVQFDEVTNDRVQIVLFEGKVKQAAPKPVASGAPAAPIQSVVVKKEEMVRIIPYPRTVKLQEFVKNDGSDAILSSLSQKLEVLLKKQLTFLPLAGVEMKKLQLDKVTDFQIRLLSPARTQYNLRKNKWIQFAWHFPLVDGVEFQIEISKELTFERMLSHKTVKQELELQFEDPAIYYWRVKALKNGETQTSLISNFEMFNKSGVGVFSRLPTGQPSGFSWEIATDQKFEHVIKNGVANEPKCQPSDLQSKTTYYCRIRDVTSNRIVKRYGFEVQ